MGTLIRKVAEKAIEHGKKLNPSDPLAQDTGAWIMDIVRNLAKYGGDLF
jgi:hypothetical protein